MKVAFDCMGTLMGADEGKVLKLYKWLEKNGHEMFIWSNSPDYAEQARRMHNLDGKLLIKTFKGEDENKSFDIAVDDDSRYSKHLSAKKVILVDQIPEDESKFSELIGG